VRKDYKGVDIQSRLGSKIKRGTLRPSNGILSDDAIGSHLVDRFARSFHGMMALEAL
jgi:hypothetical protein